jgi:ERO1-like protein beta
LWGKVQTTGLATALKILFELDEKALECVLFSSPPKLFQIGSRSSSPYSNSNLLQRNEVVALINTLHRFSESLELVEDFRRVWAETSADESKKLILEAENAATSRVSALQTPSSLMIADSRKS